MREDSNPVLHQVGVAKWEPKSERKRERGKVRRAILKTDSRKTNLPRNFATWYRKSTGNKAENRTNLSENCRQFFPINRACQAGAACNNKVPRVLFLRHLQKSTSHDLFLQILCTFPNFCMMKLPWQFTSAGDEAVFGWSNRQSLNYQIRGLTGCQCHNYPLDGMSAVLVI